jgi:anion-transporting  ArsA/GET3 family ATPase
MWDSKFGPEVYEVFSSFVDVSYAEFTEFMISILPGLRDEFVVDYIRELKLQGCYETIIWDTAPLGQTLALLETPSMLSDHLRMAPRIYSRMKIGSRSKEPIIDILKRWAKLSALNIDFIRHAVNFTYVTIAEALAVEQIEPVRLELDRYGIHISRLIVNNVVKVDGSAFLANRANNQKQYLEVIHRNFFATPIIELPLVSYEIKGVANIRKLAQSLFCSNYSAPW